MVAREDAVVAGENELKRLKDSLDAQQTELELKAANCCDDPSEDYYTKVAVDLEIQKAELAARQEKLKVEQQEQIEKQQDQNQKQKDIQEKEAMLQERAIEIAKKEAVLQAEAKTYARLQEDHTLVTGDLLSREGSAFFTAQPRYNATLLYRNTAKHP